MKACEIMESIIGKDFLENWTWTVDNCKAGDPEREVSRLGVCFAATPNVLRAAADWGAQLLITHEPTYYNHTDEFTPSDLANAKKALVEETGITIYRYHDSMHFHSDDLVSRSFLRRVGWKGVFDGQLLFTLDVPAAPTALAKDIQRALRLPALRLIGQKDGSVRKIGLYLGARDDGCYQKYLAGDVELAICGELCEWQFGEPVREAAQLGKQKTMLLLGHTASEIFAMEDCAKDVADRFPALEVRYFDCGDLFSYVLGD